MESFWFPITWNRVLVASHTVMSAHNKTSTGCTADSNSGRRLPLWNGAPAGYTKSFLAFFFEDKFASGEPSRIPGVTRALRVHRCDKDMECGGGGGLK